jgi:WD40 repeat protein
MGVVYKARQLSLDRIVAVKLILAGQFAGPQSVQRFRGEAAAAAVLRHPNIIAIHEIGLQADQHFFSMDYVEGQNLAQLVGNRPLPADQAARYVKLLAEAISYAHAQGILHRDLKPSNVIVEAATDQPRLTDFGLAKRLDGDSSLTVTGQVLGSPSFIPPEQAAPSSQKVGKRSDVYGLGAILYYLLTARPPFQALSLPATVNQVLTTEPLAPRLLNAGIPRDLETICLKCLEKEPSRRYQTAQALAEELGRLLRREPILARPAGLAEKAWRWCQRRPTIACLAGVTSLLLLTVLIGSPIAAFRINNARAAERAARRFLQAESYTEDMNLVQQAWEEGNLRRAHKLLRKHAPAQGEPELRGFEWRYLWNLCQDHSLYAFTNFENDIRALVFAPNSKFLAVGAGHIIKFLDINSYKERGEIRDADTNDVVWTMAFRPNSENILATGGILGTIRMWNLATKEITTFAQKTNSIDSLAFSPDGRLLAAACVGSLFVWSVDEKRTLWATNSDIPPRDVAFTPGGEALVSGGGGGNGNARVWDAATGKELAPFQTLHKGWLNNIAFAPDRRTVATSASDGQIILWDFAARRTNGPPIKGGDGHIAFSPDGRLVACVGVDYVARIWDTASLRPVGVIRNPGPVRTLAFTPDSTRIVCGGEDHAVRVWDVAGSADQDTLKGHERWVMQVAFSATGKTLASVDFDQALTKLWDVHTRRFITNIPCGARAGGGAAFSPDGTVLATSSFLGPVMLWDTFTLHWLRGLTNDFPVSSLAFSPDSKVLAVSSGFLTVRALGPHLAFWDVASGQKLNRLTNAAPAAAAVSFSKDGELVAVGYHTGLVRLWDWKTGSKIKEFQEHSGQVPTVAFSAGGGMLASGCDEDELVVVYGLAPPKKLKVLEGHTGGVKSIAFAPDDKTLAAAGNDGTIRLWNLATDQPVLTLKKHTGNVVSVAFSPDGNFLASCGADADVHLWPAPSFDEIARIESRR